MIPLEVIDAEGREGKDILTVRGDVRMSVDDS